MVCFLSCFGIQKKHKQRKPAKKTQRSDTVEGKYLHLDFRKSGEPDPKTRFSRNARRCSLAEKIKKKVTFSLDVKIYEPLQQEEIDSYFSDDGQEKSEWEYPSDYRYYSCRDSFDDDDIRLNESDIEEEDIDEGDDFDNGIESNNGCILIQGEERKSRVLFSGPGYIRDDRVNCVLKPMENLTQWKVVKAVEGTRFMKKNQKKPSINYKKIQNKSKPIQVDAILSNWSLPSEKKPRVTVSA
ncbi:unnamed protein product [Cuscuta campestris]|uniref:Uncharacterized protein n=1 Tax=Cuscuta campestris TaxID=132261 RepID=A0A484NKF7_9ASTE|nr:unnamed protein product [Cuscuta campestris]